MKNNYFPVKTTLDLRNVIFIGVPTKPLLPDACPLPAVHL